MTLKREQRWTALQTILRFPPFFLLDVPLQSSLGLHYKSLTPQGYRTAVTTASETQKLPLIPELVKFLLDIAIAVKLVSLMSLGPRAS